ncbi:MAG TPA: pyruvate kinase [Solirubrobacterales bacterium]|jgi:pyruvate kinase
MTPTPKRPSPRKTKILATLGPASRDEETIERLIRAGANGFRLNFSHGSQEEHAETVRRVREVSARLGEQIAILGDLPGPKLRLEELEGGAVDLLTDQELVLTTATNGGSSAGRLGVSWPELPGAVAEGDHVFLADGRIRLRVLESDGAEVRCRVEVGGRVASRQGVNLPRVRTELPVVGERDLEFVEFAARHELDLLALSFVRTAADLDPIYERLAELGADIPVIAKIEKPEAAERAEEIIKATVAGIMVARGDLGIELPLASLPVIQKRLLALAGRHARPAITATQMLASMVNSPRPTRAEVSDVANAIHQGTDVVMLSEETAIGDYPVEAVEAMVAIADAAEEDLPYREWTAFRVAPDPDDVAGTVAQAAVAAAERLGLAAIVVPTESGRTARLVSAHRPHVPVLAISPHARTARRMSMLFGVQGAVAPNAEGVLDLLDQCAGLAREHGVAESGDLIGIIAGAPSQKLGTNLFEVHRVP